MTFRQIAITTTRVLNDVAHHIHYMVAAGDDGHHKLFEKIFIHVTYFISIIRFVLLYFEDSLCIQARVY